ncbi:M14-type cytosolic carboxypeptidase [Thalassobaculum sp. OXR-137]|uniref:M14 family metallopeptidase n=1 Tax=Thalassobaculum sp. OXR-137 TaxID=3100173 RepID=UPI002AC9A156|nr:M14-type cytosolic carboxypeptidase [Thalassobaculum sp. OXR-137]WPZ34209.1 M14-type cytosolic carboxypeptidase [Thalassobaculum sp. OXR-137]
MIHISSQFDGGNIEVVDATDPSDIRLTIRKDGNSDFFQWFYFRVSGARGVPLTMTIENAGGSSYPKGWEDYRAVVSEDRANWWRTETRYDGGKLIISHTPETDFAWFAYLAPYTLEQHADLVAFAQASGAARAERLGSTLDGRDMDLLTFGSGPKPLWIIARQHPGESMAGWFVEGVVEKLCDAQDPVARALLSKATIHLVPNMNPDGVYRGNLRVNAAGTNLNREWREPSLEKSPEVYHVVRKMQETGVQMCLDVHGDEGLPYNFIAGYEGVPDVTEAHLAPLNRFRTELARLTPDFQTEHGYPKAPPGKGNLTTSTGHIAHTFRCPAMTLEMPFKDTANNPMPEVGWSPDRCKHLAGKCLDAMLLMIDDWGSGL